MTSYYALVAEEVSILDSYVDLDLRSCLMLRLITDAGVECSQSTLKEGAEPFPVHLKQFIFNKQKTTQRVCLPIGRRHTGKTEPRNAQQEDGD